MKTKCFRLFQVYLAAWLCYSVLRDNAFGCIHNVILSCIKIYQAGYQIKTLKRTAGFEGQQGLGTLICAFNTALKTLLPIPFKK